MARIDTVRTALARIDELRQRYPGRLRMLGRDIGHAEVAKALTGPTPSFDNTDPGLLGYIERQLAEGRTVVLVPESKTTMMVGTLGGSKSTRGDRIAGTGCLVLAGVAALLAVAGYGFRLWTAPGAEVIFDGQVFEFGAELAPQLASTAATRRSEQGEEVWSLASWDGQRLECIEFVADADGALARIDAAAVVLPEATNRSNRPADMLRATRSHWGNEQGSPTGASGKLMGGTCTWWVESFGDGHDRVLATVTACDDAGLGAALQHFVVGSADGDAVEAGIPPMAWSTESPTLCPLTRYRASGSR